MKKIVVFLLTIVLLSTTGCSVSLLPGKNLLPQKGSLFQKEPKNAQEFLELAKETQEKVESCHADATMTMAMDIGSGQKFEMPINFSIDSTKDVAHAIMEMNLMGQSQKQEMWMDIKDNKTYVNSGNSWVSQSSDSSITNMYDVDELSKNITDSATLDKKDGKYYITTDLKDFNMFDYLQNEELEALGDVNIGSGKVVYCFYDSSYYLESIKIQNLEMESSGYKLNMDFNMKMSKYNEINDLKIPEEVNNSKTSDDVDSSDSNEEHPSSVNTAPPTTETNQATNSGQDKYGMINGIPLTTGPNLFNGTFGADGFTISNSIS